MPLSMPTTAADTLDALLAQRAQIHPRHLALRWDGGDPQWQSLDYATLAQRARVLAQALPVERGLRVAWLAGKVTGKARATVLAQVASGEAQVVVGTHALMQEAVTFHDLGLAIVDEQHRFGVHQRLALRDKGAGANRVPHQLVMTATPIPRTLAMLQYSDLDISIIDEPSSSSPITQETATETPSRAKVTAAVVAGPPKELTD